MDTDLEAMYRERITALELLVARLLRDAGVADDLVNEWEAGAAEVHFVPGETLNAAVQIARKMGRGEVAGDR